MRIFVLPIILLLVFVSCKRKEIVGIPLKDFKSQGNNFHHPFKITFTDAGGQLVKEMHFKYTTEGAPTEKLEITRNQAGLFDSLRENYIYENGRIVLMEMHGAFPLIDTLLSLTSGNRAEITYKYNNANRLAQENFISYAGGSNKQYDLSIDFQYIHDTTFIGYTLSRGIFYGDLSASSVVEDRDTIWINDRHSSNFKVVLKNGNVLNSTHDTFAYVMENGVQVVKRVEIGYYFTYSSYENKFHPVLWESVELGNNKLKKFAFTTAQFDHLYIGSKNHLLYKKIVDEGNHISIQYREIMVDSKGRIIKIINQNDNQNVIQFFYGLDT